MRVHAVGLPHTQVTQKYEWCAYSQKLRRLPTMLQQYGHDVTLYSYGDDESDASEHVRLGDPEPWDEQHVFNDWNVDSPRWREMTTRAINAIRDQIEPRDAIGVIAGLCQQQIVDAFPGHVIAEWGIGYSGVLPNSMKAFESNAWRHYVYGFHRLQAGQFFDTVIPNAFDVGDFQFTQTPDDYLLFVSRPDPTKGFDVVAELAKHHRVVTAGQGGPRLPGVEHRGIVRGREKAELFAHARAVLVPTMYVEPFGGVCVEALMSGTPVITTDWGAFPELVTDGVDGYRCTMLAEFLDACEQVAWLDRDRIRQRAQARWSLETVALLYDDWLRRCETLYDDGWYADVKAGS